jgi:hypothetical protein
MIINRIDGIADKIDVRAYGAKGDGVTDDTKAIKAAVKVLNNKYPYGTPFLGGGGVALYFPPGVYIISEPIVIENSCYLVGAGSDQCTAVKLADNSNCDMFVIGTDTVTKPVSVWFQGFRLTMDQTKQIEGCANIRLKNMIRHSNFIDLFCYGATGYNIEFTVDEGQSTMSRNNYFDGVFCEKATYGGMLVRHSYNLNIQRSYFGFGNLASIDEFIGLNVIMSSMNLKIVNNMFLQDNWYRNLEIQSATQVVISGNNFIGKTRDGITDSCIMRLRFGMDHVIITNNTMRSSDTEFVYANGYDLGRATNVLVTNNILRGRDYGNGYRSAYTGNPFISTEDFADQYIYNNITEDGFIENYPVPE